MICCQSPRFRARWIPRQGRDRNPRFRLVCRCGAQSPIYRLPGYRTDATGRPTELNTALSHLRLWIKGDMIASFGFPPAGDATLSAFEDR